MSAQENAVPYSRDANLIEALNEPIIASRLDGTILAWSVGAEKLYGWTRAQALGKKVHELLETVSLASADEIHVALLGPEALWTGELRKTRRDGSQITVRSQQQLVAERDGEPIVIARDRDTAARSRTVDNVQRRLEDSHFLELRERFQFSTESARIGYWFCDLPFDKLIWDLRVKEHFWLPPDADVDINLFYERIHPQDRERTRRCIEESIANRTRYDIEYRTVSDSGQERWVHAIGRTGYDSVGTPVRFDGITQDITSLKRAESELRETQKQLTTFADSIPTLAWMANADGWLFWYNRRWYEYTGMGPEQLEGWGWQSVLDPDTVPATVDRWDEAIRTGQPLETILSIKGADGIFRSFLTRVTPVRNAQGEVVRWFGTNTEVDELLTTRKALQRSEERVRVALQNVPILLYTTDTELRYNWFYRPHTIYPPETLIGRRDIDIDPEKFAEIHALKQSVLSSRTPARREIRYVFNGQTQIFDYTVEPLLDADGNLLGLTVAALDVTHMRLAEETLRNTEKLALVGRLAASIAHEINNPLEAVVSLLYVAKSITTDDEVRGYLNTAEEELYRVSHVVTQALRFNRHSNAPTETRLSPLIDSALALYRGRLRNSPIELVTDYRDTEPVLCLPGELRQVFANVIGNAFEATRAGKIVLRAYPATNWRTREHGVRCVVIDTGHGIDGPTLEHIFEPFITTKGEFGTGLGLWVSAEILQRHRATVKVRSSTRPECSGTIFSIFLPQNAVNPVEDPTPQPAGQA